MQPQDLIENASFRRWVFQPTKADSDYWEAWVTEHPDHRANAELARQFLLSARGDIPALSDQTVRANVGRMLAATEADEGADKVYRLDQAGWTRRWLLRGMAASVLLVLLGGGWFLYKNRMDSGTELVAQKPEERVIEVVNDKAETRLVRLPDGSLVQLHAQARVRFPESFDAQTREVQLSGTAFFEVVKNPEKPFLVHANGLTTRVVGTSFTIYAPERGEATRVVVRTGRVAVYPSSTRAVSAPAAASTVLLTANQQATYREGDARPEKEEVAPAERIAASQSTPRFSFRRTPLVRVFQQLEQTYGIRLTYDANAVANCTLTAQLDDQSLFEKLEVITASTGTTYELTGDGTIRIRPGNGCQ